MTTLCVCGDIEKTIGWIRSRTIECLDTYASESHVENAKAVAIELSQIITQLKDFDVRMKRALNIDTLVNVLEPVMSGIKIARRLRFHCV